ncbi:MAG: galactose-1-phosphate uridylyltransferase [Bacteroidota bacterium]
MPQLRQNIITRDWVIIAPERATRPNDLALERKPRRPAARYDPACPFCPGNEHLTKREVFRVETDQGWQVRVVGNKYPVLSPDGERVRSSAGIYRSMAGVGTHEVIVEHPRHDLSPALYDVEQLAAVFTSYRARYRDIRQDDRIEAIIIFKNHGERAGTSLGHPHSQLAATPVVPAQIRTRVEEATRFFDDTGECVFCQTLREELEDQDRIVCETAHFVAFIPYAALSPFHLWIFPRRHMSSFDDISDIETGDLALVLRTVLSKMYRGLKDPDYNYSVRSLPTRDRNTDYFHWYLTIIPRISRTAGFELGSGMFINSTVPEESAAFLRGVVVPGK